MSLLSLPLVMLHSIMHFMHGPELGQLARCCRAMADASRCKFAWRHSLLQVRSYRRLIDLKKGAPVRAPPIALVVKWDQEVYLSNSLALIHQTGMRLLQLRFEGIPLESTITESLVLPCMQGLQVLRLPASRRYGPATVSLIARLPSLRTLEIHADRFVPHAHWSSLAACASLTALETSDDGLLDELEPNSLQVIAASCAQIRQLKLTRVASSRPWTLPHLADTLCFRSIEALTLDAFSMTASGTTVSALGTLTAQLSRLFASMPRLSSLTLHHVCFVDWLLPTLPSAAALRSLQIELECSIYRQQLQGAPSEGVLLSLLSANPQLHCSIVLPSAPAYVSEANLDLLSQLQRRYSQAARLQLQSVSAQFHVKSAS